MNPEEMSFEAEAYVEVMGTLTKKPLKPSQEFFRLSYIRQPRMTCVPVDQHHWVDAVPTQYLPPNVVGAERCLHQHETL